MKLNKGEIYYCPVCGVEIVVSNAGNGDANLRCCNRDMLKKNERAVIYYCERCGAEIVVVYGDDKNLEPFCCNEPMKRLTDSHY